MKFIWNVNYITGYEKNHTLICLQEEEIVNADLSPFEVKLCDDDGEIITDNVNLVYYVNNEENIFDNDNNVIPCISGNLPDGIKIKKIRTGKYGFEGQLPIINEETTYYFTIRVKAEVNDESYYDDMFFSIIVKNKSLYFVNNSPYIFTENLYTKYQLELLNAEGNEEFVKISGNLPNGIQLSLNGLLYGIPYINKNIEDEEGNINCTIGIRRNGEIILEKIITTNVVTLSSLSTPIWITDAGQIASINYGVEIDSTIFVKAYDPNGLMLKYELVSGYELPDGLYLNNSTGQIYGKCLTKEEKIWSIRISASNGTETIERLFKIETNKVSDDKYIKWITNNNLGSYKVGNNVFLKLETESNYNVTYKLVSNTIPLGLSFNNGLIYGKIKYQDLKTYNFIIEANNGYNTVQEKFSMTITQGYGKNAVKCYFNINHEYDDDYGEMRSYFNKVNAYETRNALYKINSNPEIDICECSCFDTQLMSHLLDFNESLDITWGKTIRNDYFVDNNLIYSVFYKSLMENLPSGGYQNYGGDKIYVTRDSRSSTGYYLENTTTEIVPTQEPIRDPNDIIKGKPYIKYNGKNVDIKIVNENNYYITSNNELVDDNEPKYIEQYEEYNIYTYETEIFYRKYILINDEKVYISPCENNSMADVKNNLYLGLKANEVEIFYHKDIVRQYFIDDKRDSIAFPSTSEIRRVLSKRINVTKSNNEHIYYDPGSQEIISEEYFDKEYVLYYDKDKESYYVSYNGKKVYMDVYATNIKEGETTDTSIEPVYAKIYNNNWKQIDNKNASQTSFDDTWDNRNADTIEFSRYIDGNETKYLLKPVKVLIDFLDTDVDYNNYLIYEKDSEHKPENLQENILFTLSWTPYTKFVILNGVSHIIEEISKPWIYEPESNREIGFEKRIVLPYITDDDVIKTSNNKGYIKFFNPDIETISEWKTRKVDFYKPDTYYYIGDIFKVDTLDGLIYYKVKANFKSGDNYEDYKTDYLTYISKDVIDDYLKPYYFPTLDLFYAKPYTEYGKYKDSASSLPGTMQQDEENGKLLTGRKFCFFEVHFSPLYNNNIDNFTIDFYNHNSKRSPEFQLI